MTHEKPSPQEQVAGWTGETTAGTLAVAWTFGPLGGDDTDLHRNDLQRIISDGICCCKSIVQKMFWGGGGEVEYAR